MLIRSVLCWPCLIAVAAHAQPETPPAPAPASPPATTPVPAPLEPVPNQEAPAAPANPQPAAPETQPSQPTEPPPSQPLAAGEEREVVVTLRDGQRYTGTLVSRDDKTVVIKIAGITTTLNAGQVDRVQMLPSVQERYRQMRASLDDADVEGLLRLVAWLRTKAQFESALAELEHVLQVQPDHPQAADLKLQIEAQRELTRNAGLGKRPPPPKNAPEEGPASIVRLLSDREINLIKVYEVDLADPPRMVIDRETIQNLIEQYEGDPLIPSSPEGRNALFRASPAKILDTMFRIQARNLYERVKVIDQPRSMKHFRERVHGKWLINSCATTQCHGGTEAGRFMLATDKPNSDATVYTNFLILDRFRTRDGKPLINYDKPESSTLLQMALGRDRSREAHPEVPGRQGNTDLFRPAFRTEDDPRFRDALTWIKSMYRPRPEYPVQYTLPGPEGIVPVDPDAPPVIR